MRGNTKLIDYGIQNDKSDYRAHVCVNARYVYVYKTQLALAMLAAPNHFMKRDVFTGNIKTAIGYTVPWPLIPEIRQIEIPITWWDKIKFDEKETTTIKGNKAVTIVKGMLKRGLFPFFAEGKEIDDIDIQIEGFDLSVFLQINIQVKCDYRGGGKAGMPGTTGNLFLQIAECNPYKQT